MQTNNHGRCHVVACRHHLTLRCPLSAAIHRCQPLKLIVIVAAVHFDCDFSFRFHFI